MKVFTAAGALAAMLLTAPAVGQSPDPIDPGRLHATRAQLQDLLAHYEKALGSQAYSRHMREIADDEAELIRTRLRDGDFQVGDQIVLAVVGQPTLTSTFAVSDGPILVLPDVGEVPLRGLLRSELKPALNEHVSKFVRNPQIHVQSNIRVAVFGAIGSPGYYVAASDRPLTDVLMLAGGPGPSAKQKDLKIKRAGNTIWEGESLQRAIVEGRTLDQLNLRAGDEIQMPGSGNSAGFLLGALRSLPYILSAIFALTRIL